VVAAGASAGAVPAPDGGVVVCATAPVASKAATAAVIDKLFKVMVILSIAKLKLQLEG
jgi:hypothetical protein